jgi:hypothetical protein
MCIVVNPYLIETDGVGADARPRQLRERIRAIGPDVGILGLSF